MPRAARTVNRLGIAGAGTMGAGIAQTAIVAGLPTVLIDPSPEAIDRATSAIAAALDRGVGRGRWSAADARAAQGRLTVGAGPDSLAGADLVVEAVPERLELKHDVLRSVAEACGREAILATNTSSLLVSAVAAEVPDPERVVGLHFFNPVPSMRLVEVVAGTRTAADVHTTACALGERLGKRVVVAHDGVGFLVNRCGRPFVGEGLRLVLERVATPEQIDRICRMGGGFRMGPFELADLIGLDVNLEIAESFYRQSYGEPRWRPSPIQARLVAAGRLGRKSGEGFFDYRDGPHRPPDPAPLSPGGGRDRVVVVGGRGPVARGLRARAERAGFVLRGEHERASADIYLVVDADPERAVSCRPDDAAVLRAMFCAGRSLAETTDRRTAGFHVLPQLDECRLAETCARSDADPAAIARTEAFLTALGFHVERVGDAPGLVLGRILAQLVNEAAFAIGEGVGSPAGVEEGATLGLNHPRGPVAWSELLGLAHVRTVLRALREQLGEERYRLAPLLTRRGSLID